MINIIATHKNDIVRKSDFLVKARYKLNPLAIKFITLVIANVKKSDEVDKEYVFRVKDFMELSGMEYKQLYSYGRAVKKPFENTERKRIFEA